MFAIDDIMWLDAIVVLTGRCKIFKKETGKVDGEQSRLSEGAQTILRRKR
jgi:hypothetical protein